MKLSTSVVAIILVFASAPGFALAEPDAHAIMQHTDHCGLPMGEGTLTSIDVKNSKTTVDHDPIAILGWDAMEMNLSTTKSIDLSAFTAGDRVHFLLAMNPKSQSFRIEAMCALDAPEGLHETCMSHMHKTAMLLAEKAGSSCETSGVDHGATAVDHSHH